MDSNPTAVVARVPHLRRGLAGHRPSSASRPGMPSAKRCTSPCKGEVVDLTRACLLSKGAGQHFVAIPNRSESPSADELRFGSALTRASVGVFPERHDLEHSPEHSLPTRPIRHRMDRSALDHFDLCSRPQTHPYDVSARSPQSVTLSVSPTGEANSPGSSGGNLSYASTRNSLDLDDKTWHEDASMGLDDWRLASRDLDSKLVCPDNRTCGTMKGVLLQRRVSTFSRMNESHFGPRRQIHDALSSPKQRADRAGGTRQRAVPKLKAPLALPCAAGWLATVSKSSLSTQMQHDDSSVHVVTSALRPNAFRIRPRTAHHIRSSRGW